MVYLNFTDLSKETQKRLLVSSKEEIKRKYGKDIIKYASLNNINLDTMLEKKRYEIYILINTLSVFNSIVQFNC
jgi:hypothetical protein